MNAKYLFILVFCTAAFSAFAQPMPNSAPREVEVVVPARDIARGAVISEDDLTYQSVSVMRASSGIIRAIPDAMGKEARRGLRAGELIRSSDVKRPTLVAKGSTVTMVFDAPGMRLTAVGRALAEGGEGDSIAVLNPTSYRQVEATVVAPGTVRVGGALTMGTINNDLAQARP
jgi:flagella basal body P-ring formation protein FlgA